MFCSACSIRNCITKPTFIFHRHKHSCMFSTVKKCKSTCVTVIRQKCKNMNKYKANTIKYVLINVIFHDSCEQLFLILNIGRRECVVWLTNVLAALGARNDQQSRDHKALES